MKTCSLCQTSFEVLQRDRSFYQKIAVPEPTNCPQCRIKKRFAFRNERKLYKRKCDLTGKEIISFHHPDKPHRIYEHTAWWSDQWDALDYGRAFNFSRSFFEQFGELQKQVPRISMTISHCENSDYAPYSVYSKNCYLCISCCRSEDLQYCYQTNFSKNCFDCSLSGTCELCYECLYCINLFDSAFCQNCENSSNLIFCQDCRGCENLIGCKNLVNKKYHLFNQPVSKEEFNSVKASLDDYQNLRTMQQKAAAFFLTQPQRASYLINCESSTGDHLKNCKNTLASFNSSELQDCAYLYTVPYNAKDAQDIHYSPGAELVYDSMSAVNNYGTKFVLHSWDMKDSAYVDECFYSSDLFGSIGLRNKKYCLLNKQYTKEEYLSLRDRVITHMQRTGEWGQFFPVTLSPYAYNETIAQDYFPLEKSEVLRHGWQWRDEDHHVPQAERIIPAAKLPDRIKEIPDDILNWAIQCQATGRPFRITPQELHFYRQSNLPIPHLHPDERYEKRMALNNPWQLYSRTCTKCQAPIQTTYSPDRPEIVYCEQCYLKNIY